MSRWNSFKQLFGSSDIKESRTWRAIARMWAPERAVWTPHEPGKLAMEGYETNVYAYACTRLLANSAGRVPWILYGRKSSGANAEYEQVNTHPLLDILKRPNPLMGQSKLIESMVTWLSISGSSYTEWAGPIPTSKKGELYQLRSDRMSVIPGTGENLVGGYEYRAGTQKPSRFDPEEVLHLTYYRPTSDFYGLSPMEVASRAIDQNNEAKAWNVALLQNMARPSGLLISEEALTDQEFERMKAQFSEEYSGPTRSGKPLVLEGGLKWENISYSPAEMDWLEAQKHTMREICAAFHIPPQMLGDYEGSTYSNYQEARQAFYMETVLPLMDMIRDELNRWLVPKFKDGDRLYLDYDLSSIDAIQENRAEKWKMAMEGFQNGIITVNEARQLLQYEPLDEGDTLITDLTGKEEKAITAGDIPLGISSSGRP